MWLKGARAPGSFRGGESGVPLGDVRGEEDGAGRDSFRSARSSQEAPRWWAAPPGGGTSGEEEEFGTVLMGVGTGESARSHPAVPVARASLLGLQVPDSAFSQENPLPSSFRLLAEPIALLLSYTGSSIPCP